ncbi:MAG: hypothetical protein ACP2W7_02395 [Buchnera aphidicola (Tetraneura sorini)]
MIVNFYKKKNKIKCNSYLNKNYDSFLNLDYLKKKRIKKKQQYILKNFQEKKSCLLIK